MNLLRWVFKSKIRFKTFAQEKATEAFRYKGKIYYHFTDSFKMPAGRAIAALAIYEELKMRCDDEYLKKHIRATELILNPESRRIDLSKLVLINNNLKERLNLAPFPDHIYKLASVTFFDEYENPFNYDFAYNEKKIKEWKRDPDMLYFFLKMQFSDLMPFGNMSKETAEGYFRTTEKINQIHLKQLQEIISNSN